MQTSEVAVESAKLSKYKSIINELSEINYQTLKKLLCHLNSIVSNCYQNHMTVTNLAVVFSPTIMSMRQEDEQFPDKHELVVVMDLISHYRYLFEVDPNENQKDMIIRQKMEELQQLQSVKAQNAGNFHIPFFIHNLEGESNNIQVSNYTTAQEIVEFAINRKWLSGDHSKWSVYEIICNQDLQRPLHYAERVFEVALQHSQFPCSESNALCIKPNSLYRGVLNLAEQPFSLFSEIFYGDRLKQFRKASAEFSNAKLTIYKSAEGQRKLGTWNIEDIKWYIGAEKSRIPPTQWPITFLELDATRKHDQWASKGFGKVISCLSSQERDKWVAAMLLGQYPRDLLPPEKLIDI
ncbi:PREDICTED: arf-GAP with Rho-GAP domain, ANK repeat and PH domain-containing protein 2-like [Priapulus caudatus]|uniref:Arf-GAP with Rho-GAP domain, ANK repeat and PH domain-containing protein 2-like n=1 Tax=Priapulus caudatus TaxID=37621 RepID=A0ABM1EZB0_PRICU|nr:PREDICTED: arf-GAP with Rho-GAP domain, ANK repeat and PH domain-containing protein 2-like [Priapulus caudatus]